MLIATRVLKLRQTAGVVDLPIRIIRLGGKGPPGFVNLRWAGLMARSQWTPAGLTLCRRLSSR